MDDTQEEAEEVQFSVHVENKETFDQNQVNSEVQETMQSQVIIGGKND